MSEKVNMGNDIPKPIGHIPDNVWNQVVAGAKNAEAQYGIPASVTLAQFIQETGGDPNNFIGGTNIFGIKGSGDAGSMQMPTTEYDANGNKYNTNANFAVYSSIPAAVSAHAKLLTQNPAYSKLQGLLQKGVQDPGQYFGALQGTYATDPNYAKNLTNIAASFGLHHSDDHQGSPLAQYAGGPQSSLQSTQRQPQPSGLGKYTVQQGDSLSGIAQKYYGNPQAYNRLSGYSSGNPNLIYPGEQLNLG